jgi:CRP-like cAMP-binding protein
VISPELLRRYTFFSGTNDDQLKKLAMIGGECEFKAGEIFFKEGDNAEMMYILMTGVVDLFFTVGKENKPRKDYLVEEISSGDPFGISALIEPFVFTSNARASTDCKVIRLDGPALRSLCSEDKELRYALTKQTARIYAERLRSARVQIAASQE